MAQRRMFSKKITDTDTFLDMPMSTQCLYFHLNMNADDDGFVANAKMVRRVIGASEDDMRLLLAKEFLIPFQNGLVVIKDWKIHNYIAKDRYQPTVYQTERQKLAETASKAYQWSIPRVGAADEMIKASNASDSKDSESCIQNVDEMDTQVRLGKVSKGKVRVVEDRLKEGQINDVDNVADSLGIITAFWEENDFGKMQPSTSEKLQAWLTRFNNNEALIIKALEVTIAQGQGKCHFSYVNSILEDWWRRQLFSVAAVVTAEQRWRQAQKKPQKTGITTDIVPDWLAQQLEAEETASANQQEEAVVVPTIHKQPPVIVTDESVLAMIAAFREENDCQKGGGEG